MPDRDLHSHEELNERADWLTALRFALVAILLFGLLMPSALVFVGGWLFPAQAKGSLVLRDDQVVGSRLIAQAFVSDRYFYPRPSAANYDPRVMAGSNLAPSNPALAALIQSRAMAIATRESVGIDAIPADLLTASGSGMDPHISVAAALLQSERVARARGLSLAQVQHAVQAATEGPSFGIFGQTRVNVLELNLALDGG